MVTHTSNLDFSCQQPQYHHHYYCRSGDCRTSPILLPDLSWICIMWRMVLMQSADKLAAFHARNDQQMCRRSVENSIKNIVAAKVGTCLCMWVRLLPGVSPLLSSQSDFFIHPEGVCACLTVCLWVCPGWPREVFPPYFQLHASLSPGELLSAARAKGNT